MDREKETGLKAVIEELGLVRTATDKRMEGARRAVNPMRDY